jgi:hypothetical protein
MVILFHLFQFLNWSLDNFVTQHVDFSTHVSGNTLDLVMSSPPNLVSNISDEGHLGNSDHVLLTWEIAATSSLSPSTELIYNYNKANFSDLNNKLSNTDWTAELCHDNIERNWTRFKNVLFDAVDSCIPKKLRRVNSEPAWMTKPILQQIRAKRRAWKRYRSTKSHHDFRFYQEKVKKVKSAVKKAKFTYERNIAKNSKFNSKPFYSYLKQNLNVREGVGPLKDENGDIVSDPTSQANILTTTLLLYLLTKTPAMFLTQEILHESQTLHCLLSPKRS